jgi:hypothetical protein
MGATNAIVQGLSGAVGVFVHVDDKSFHAVARTVLVALRLVRASLVK